MAVKSTDRRSKRAIVWECICDCGNVHFTTSERLNNGTVKSCGCLSKELIRLRNTSHGETDSRLHITWRSMKNRCSLTVKKVNPDYGGRGIKVCHEWQEFVPFRDWALANGYRDNLTIERVDVNGNYEPSNCTWISKAQQPKNSRQVRMIAFNGKQMILSEWAEHLGVKYSTLHARINNYGLPIEIALRKRVKMGPKKVSRVF